MQRKASLWDVRHKVAWLAKWEWAGQQEGHQLDQRAVEKALVALGEAARPVIRSFIEREWQTQGQ